MRQVAGIAVAFILLGSHPGAAQETDRETADGRLNAFACETLPSPLRLSVEVMDNTEQFLRLRDSFVERLKGAGVQVADGTPLVLMLDVRKLVEFEQQSGGQLFELRAGQEDEDIGRDGELFMRGNVWSNRSDSVLGGRKRDPGQLATDQVEVSASINSRSDGRCLWRGEVRHELNGDDTLDAAQRIVPFLAGALGQTVRDRPLEIAR
jgi:hypothetical protein